MNDLYKAIISGVVIVGAIGGIITFVYKKVSDIYHACQEYCSKTEEPYPTFAFSVPNVEDTYLMGNGSGDADSSEVPL